MDARRAALPIAARAAMSAKTVKDVPAAAFVKEYAAHLKRSGKIELPPWVDLVKTSVAKELAPYDPDWYYIRAASIARHVYIRPDVGVGGFKKRFGSKYRRGTRAMHHRDAAGGHIRHMLQQLEAIKVIRKSDKGGRRITPDGQRDLDRIASKVVLAGESKEEDEDEDEDESEEEESEEESESDDDDDSDEGASRRRGRGRSRSRCLLRACALARARAPATRAFLRCRRGTHCMPAQLLTSKRPSPRTHAINRVSAAPAATGARVRAGGGKQTAASCSSVIWPPGAVRRHSPPLSGGGKWARARARALCLRRWDLTTQPRCDLFAAHASRRASRRGASATGAP